MSSFFCPICAKEHDVEADDGEVQFSFIYEVSGALIEKVVCFETGIILGYRKLPIAEISAIGS